MKVLALDTATGACSVALADDGGTIAELNYFHGKTHSIHLASMVDKLLEVAAVGIEAVDAYAVNSGPGTFTGLRIGMAAIKGFAAATGKPVVGVSSMDVLANQAGFLPGYICAMIDARRGEVYTALYAARGKTVKRVSGPEALSPREAVEAIEGPCLFTGSGAVAYRGVILEIAGQTARFTAHEANYPRASTVARMGIEKLRARDFSCGASLVPNYIRRSDAEIKHPGPEKRALGYP